MTAVENDFVEGVYDKLASVYDWIFGPTLHPGRLQAIQRMGISPGDRVLEVGVGTGINAALYPRDCAVTGVDLSASMLEKARERIARKGHHQRPRCWRWTRPASPFPTTRSTSSTRPTSSASCPTPCGWPREMNRVCRPGGRIIFLNHFRSPNFLLSRIERLISPFTVHIGFKADLDLPAFLAQAELQPVSIEKVNVPRIWSLVTCIKSEE